MLPDRDVDQMLGDGRLARLPANPVGAQGLIDKAQTHLGSAAVLAGTDVELAYDAVHAADRMRPDRPEGRLGQSGQRTSAPLAGLAMGMQAPIASL